MFENENFSHKPWTLLYNMPKAVKRILIVAIRSNAFCILSWLCSINVSLGFHHRLPFANERSDLIDFSLNLRAALRPHCSIYVPLRWSVFCQGGANHFLSCHLILFCCFYKCIYDFTENNVCSRWSLSFLVRVVICVSAVIRSCGNVLKQAIAWLPARWVDLAFCTFPLSPLAWFFISWSRQLWRLLWR